MLSKVVILIMRFIFQNIKVATSAVQFFMRYHKTYCLMQGSCFICRTFKNLRTFYLKIRITTFKTNLLLDLILLVILQE